MDYGFHIEAPYVYTFFAGIVTALFRPVPPAVPVVAACTCQCDCSGTAQWGARALLLLGALGLASLQALAVGGYWLAQSRGRASRTARAAPSHTRPSAGPAPGASRPSASHHPRALPPDQ